MSTQSTQAPAAAHAAADPHALPEGRFQATASGEPRYSLRIAARAARCAGCGEPVSEAGPVGYLDDDPICDLCLLGGSNELGMVLAMILVARAYASTRDGIPEERAALEELGAFARVYDCFAAKTWPARILAPRFCELLKT